MMKWLTIFGSTILIGAVILVVRYDEIHRTEGKGYDIKCTQSSEPSVTMNSLICTAEHSQKTKSSESGPPWWHVFITWPEGITATALIATLGVFCIQAILMRVHAKEFKNLAKSAADNAEAAKLSAQAVIDAERPWLVVQFVQTNDLKTGALPIFNITCINQGKTPALIKRIDATFKVVTNPSELPVPMKDLGPMVLPDLMFIVNRDSFKVWEGLRLDTILVSAADMAEVYIDGKFLVFFGRVEYDDVFDSGESKKRHVTSWCYAYCQGRSKSRPVGRSKSRPVDSLEGTGYAGSVASGA
jgi:hypothetical protein